LHGEVVLNMLGASIQYTHSLKSRVNYIFAPPKRNSLLNWIAVQTLKRCSKSSSLDFKKL